MIWKSEIPVSKVALYESRFCSVKENASKHETRPLDSGLYPFALRSSKDLRERMSARAREIQRAG